MGLPIIPVPTDSGKAGEKFVEVVAKGIGAIFAPRQMIRMARAEIEVKRMRARTDAEDELAKLRALPPPPDLALTEGAEPTTYTLVQRGTNRFEYQQAKREANIEDIVMGAALDLGAGASDTPVDDDWTARFFSNAQDVSNEEMKALWSKVLAGEVNRPGRFSLRCLDVLRNLSPSEASAFEKVAACATADGAIVSMGRRDFFKLGGEVTLGMLLSAHDAGLLLAPNGDIVLPLRDETNQFRPCVLNYQDFALVVNRAPTGTLPFVNLSIFSLSTAGGELARAIGAATNRAYLREVVGFVRTHGLLVHVSAQPGRATKEDVDALMAP